MTQKKPEQTTRTASISGRQRLLITAGPTHEPIDAVRYIANRSSGTLGIALAQHAASAGWQVTLLLGPTPNKAQSNDALTTHRYTTTADLEQLLIEHQPNCDALVMAAAVADYRPKGGAERAQQKLRRTDQKLSLELEPTPDLLAGCAQRREAGGYTQTLVGFALEPQDQLMASAKAKLARKGVDAIVANPLQTMDAGEIEATFVTAEPLQELDVQTPGSISKQDFAPWLLERVSVLFDSISAQN